MAMRTKTLATRTNHALRLSKTGAAVKTMLSRINLAARGINCKTEYGRHMHDLSRRIFTEPQRTTASKNLKVVRIMSEEPLEQQSFKTIDYYPNQPMFHYLTKMLRFHGLYFDEHVEWREVQNRLKLARGKMLYPPIGQGKRAQLRSEKK
ncbi:28S ribosomal protein S33 [Loa loa]|uniref:Small ribosomal subunit protein mS33 n=1 Tax=Loa loa TaxID=7209 RepID=A0A1I7VVC1_LOALO|nr:28S ribosomal protein S33 [Loa loa]EFO28400.1 28S ribosomal protein S33 [Loa loa]